jgi:excinuclease ABC subunit C
MKEKLVALAHENAEMVLSRDRERLKREELRSIGAVKEIAALLRLEKADRIESYDISNISGFDSVGSMVVYVKGKPRKNDYRKFRIKWVVGPDDYASMDEVLTRRFMRAREGSEGFTDLPDIVLMDGGKGQVHIAEEVLRRVGFDIPVAGMVKDDYHRTRGLYYNNVELPIDTRSEGFKLITRVQDEAHRFAIEYHKQLRRTNQVRSILDEIPGVGPSRRKALLKYFKDIDNIREASLEELESLPEIPKSTAGYIYRFFHE